MKFLGKDLALKEQVTVDVRSWNHNPSYTSPYLFASANPPECGKWSKPPLKLRGGKGEL